MTRDESSERRRCTIQLDGISNDGWREKLANHLRRRQFTSLRSPTEVVQHVVVGHRQAERLLNLPNVFAATQQAIDLGQRTILPLLQSPTADHRAYRRFLNRHISEQLPGYELTANQTVDRLVGSIPEGPVDLVQEVVRPLAGTMLAEFLGLPSADCDQHWSWYDDIITSAFEGKPRLFREKVHAEMVDYFLEVIAAHTGDGGVIGAFRSHPIAGVESDDHELARLLHVLLVAGLGTVADANSLIVASLLTRWDEWSDLAAEPDSFRLAFEELMRWHSPVPAITRQAITDTWLGDSEILTGTKIICDLSTINHDPDRFDEPDTLNFRRSPNPHLAMGAGVHRCPGGRLAVVQAKATLNSLLAKQRPSTFSTDPGVPEDPSVRAYSSILVTFDQPATAAI